MCRAESKPGHSTVVLVRVPETVLRVKGTGQWAWLGQLVDDAVSGRDCCCFSAV